MAYPNLICVGFMVIIAWFTYTKSRRSRAANEINKSRIWMVVSIMVGVLAVLNILSLFV
jgi:ABC-type iron transport system FetAB permease component